MAAAAMTRKLRVENFERVSTDRQETERQQFDLADNVEQFDLEVVATTRLKISGPKVNTKPDWQAMLERMQTADRDGINLSALDRLFRPEDFAIIAEALQVFRDFKKVIVSTKEGLIEPWTPRGWETCMQAVLQAGKELAELKRRTAGGRRKAHAANKPMNCEPPYGLLYRDKYSKDAAGKCQYFYEDPTPASNGQSRREVVEMIFNWRYIERMRIHRIVRRLNELGILTGGKKKKDGTWQYAPGMWTRSTVSQLLRNRHYIGEHVEGGKQIDVACPSFIDREVFEAVQASFLVEKDSPDKKGRDSSEALLHEYILCDRCRHSMYFNQRPHRHHVYRCHHLDSKLLTRKCTMGQIRADVIEPVVFLAIWQHLTDWKLLLANARAYYDSLPARPEAAALENELADVMARIERTKRMVRLGTYDEDEGNAAILADQKRIAELKADLKTAGVLTMPSQHEMESYCRWIADAAGRGTMPSQFDTQRPVLEKLFDLKVYYDGENAVIEGRIPVPAAAAAKGRKCSGRINSAITSTLFIPLKLKVAVVKPARKTTRAASLKGWETRRKNGTVAAFSPEARRAAGLKAWEVRRQKKERAA